VKWYVSLELTSPFKNWF